MNGVSGHDSALFRQYWAGDNLTNEMNFVISITSSANPDVAIVTLLQ